LLSPPYADLQSVIGACASSNDDNFPRHQTHICTPPSTVVIFLPTSFAISFGYHREIITVNSGWRGWRLWIRVPFLAEPRNNFIDRKADLR